MGRANILVRNLYCTNCADGIKRELSQIKNISNIYLCLKESSISFNFDFANDISTVENLLVFLGYPPREDVITKKRTSLCYCQNTKGDKFIL